MYKHIVKLDESNEEEEYAGEERRDRREMDGYAAGERLAERTYQQTVEGFQG